MLLLPGCNPTESISAAELTMKVPEGMTDVSKESDNLMFNFALKNETMFICGLRQDFIDIPDGSTLTLEDYTHQLMELYQMHDTIHDQRPGEDYIYLRFQVPLADGVHQYLCGVYRSKSAFWLIQMDAKNADFEEERFFTYLDSVSFTD